MVNVDTKFNEVPTCIVFKERPDLYHLSGVLTKKNSSLLGSLKEIVASGKKSEMSLEEMKSLTYIADEDRKIGKLCDNCSVPSVGFIYLHLNGRQGLRNWKFIIYKKMKILDCKSKDVKEDIAAEAKASVHGLVLYDHFVSFDRRRLGDRVVVLVEEKVGLEDRVSSLDESFSLVN